MILFFSLHNTGPLGASLQPLPALLRTFTLLLLLSALTGMSAAWGADISGRAALPGGAATRDAVVFLESAEAARDVQPLPNAVVDQRGKVFIPHVLTVTRGTKVRFPNNDTIFHNVFAYFEAKKFDLGMYPRGAQRVQTFEKPGVVALLCNIHPRMSAYIVVVDTPYFAVTDAKGRFQIEDVPPGSYTLKVWHESGARLSRTLRVGSASEPLELVLEKK